MNNMNINEDDGNTQPVEQMKVSYREMIECLSNMEWVDRDIFVDGSLIVDAVFDDLLTLWKKKGYAVPEEENFHSNVLILIDQIVKDQLYKAFTEIQVETAAIYNSFIEQYYQ
jgi:hypothetical protein